MTAHAMQGDREKCLSAGMDDYVTKPVQVRDLKQALERWQTMSQNTKKQTDSNPGVQKGGPTFASQSGKDDKATEAPVDLVRISELTSDDPQKLQRLIGNYLKQAEEILPLLSRAVETGSANDIRLLAHKWGGSSSNCGMTALAKHLCALECLGEGGVLHQASQFHADVLKEFDRVRTFLQEQVSSESDSKS